MSKRDGVDTEHRLAAVRKLRVRTHRADDLLKQASDELEQVRESAGSLGVPGARFGRKLEEIERALDRILTDPSHAADQLEQEYHDAVPEPPSAAELIVNGGEVAEPDAHALGLLLDVVEYGSSEALDFENRLSREAFVWLLRQHPPAVKHIRKLADVAGKVNSDHIKWAGKKVLD